MQANVRHRPDRFTLRQADAAREGETALLATTADMLHSSVARR
jgi:hypothetical protein